MFEGLRFQHWQTASDADGIVVLTLDRAGSSVNALSRAVLDELSEIVERLAIEPPRGVIVRSAKANGFIVGADIKEFEGFGKNGTVQDALENGQRVFLRLGRLPCPTVAAIHGVCMGGGTELALACRQRVASRDPSTRIALPEVKLGIFPGWGGSARLPRLVGAPAALELMLTGRTASAENAKAIGLVDTLTSPELLVEAAKELVRHPRSRPFKQRATAWATNTWLARQILAPILVKQTAAKVRKEHYPAPFALIETWRRGGSSLVQRLKLEARAVAKLAATPTAHNLIRVFFLQERLKGLAGGAEHGIKHVHVVGAGVMGGDIAAWCALRGFDVTLQDREMKYVQPALDRAKDLFTKKLKTAERVAPALARLKADVEGSGIPDADLAIEAIYENAEAKEALYRATEPKMKPGALLATNTSSIPLAELRTTVQQPGRFLGLHYFNPVALMPLVEIVRHDQLDAAAEKRALAFCKALDKLPVPVAGTPGFLVNRILMPYMLEAARAYSEGVPGPVIDRAAKKFGMPMGPIELIDTVGLDVAASVGAELGPFLGLDIPPGLDELVKGGKRGKKDGEGFYIWKDGKPQKPEVDPSYVAPDDLEDRLVLPLLNEAVACLHDRVVDDADLLDAGVIFGTGFAPFRGGPIKHVRDTGADALKARLGALASKYGARFSPRPGWDSPALRS
ncbi:3-hydroxyacyl-CoA dehydrogenase NAD-binding domain-containing protein [Dokdonella fugitiva]|uniref:3-hydroxyacyl-CoA dehydrogenase NAD-binding domain-containing protein n=1 Tax=Dokdonella fugitiva TaxID=328517 RepID=UPI0015FDB4D0|nr:3-hydroxyacyl-CoA dehydrogenase NAD-binding domain-containing protein [Dokdonella fugitiva]MBA8883222.1 3-hydroxyacyl-CoA dehydrogenase/enoyl-CoA hydratase/3-hydroxybutyryl-CoA epimerase [Dokdonella fugitiva]